MNEIDIKQEPFFPLNFRIFGGIILFGCILFYLPSSFDSLSLLRVIITLLFLSLGTFLITARYGLKINVAAKSYTVYTYVFGFKTGQPETFNYIEKFYINQVTENAMATTRTGAKYDIKNKVFKAFMKLDNGEKIHVDTDKNESALEQRITEYIKSLKPLYNPSEQ